MQGVTKRFGKVTACDNVDLSLNQGEIHGLLGENGAGKSTLMKILLGLERPDEGRIFLDGDTIDINSPHDARQCGIDMVHQHFSLVGPLTVWQNVVLGDVGKVRRNVACEQVSRVAEHYSLPIDPLARVDELSAGQRQRVELIKCLRREPAHLILDEPTSVLTQAESEELFSVLREMVQVENRAIIVISHKLAEITAATDKITVLRRGRVVHESATANTSHYELARQMVGKEVSLANVAPTLGGAPAQPDAAVNDVNSGEYASQDRNDANAALSIEEICVNENGVQLLDSCSLDVAAGEILGLYGVEGNGQSTLGDVLSGLVEVNSGSVRILGKIVELKRPGALTHSGLGIIPENRHRSGVILSLSVAENLAMKSLNTITKRALISRRLMNEQARTLMEEYNIICPSPDTAVGNLSGGNQQRVVLARELSNAPRVLVVAQPTQGLDIGAIDDMYTRLRKAAANGVAVLLISTELDEIMALSTRIAVISSGRITGQMPATDITSEQLGYMVGGRNHE